MNSCKPPSRATLVPVPGYEGLYVTKGGRLWSTRNGNRWHKAFLSIDGAKELRGYLRPSGYVFVTVGKRLSLGMHEIIAATFLGPRPNGFQICHNNGVKHDNRLRNLRYDTKSGNQRDRIKHGTHIRGSRHPQAILNERVVRKIRKLSSAGRSQHSLAAQFGVARTTIQHIVERTSWKWLK